MWPFKKSGIAGPEARRLVAAGARLIDVRSPAEFSSGALPGAINVPLEQLPARLKDVGQAGQTVIVYCLSGARSARAKSLLENRGFTAVHNLGAMRSW